MAVVSLAQLKSYFNRKDKPTEAQYVDLIDTLAPTSNNLRTLEYTIGVAGVSGVDYNFTSVANTTEQSIQLGGTTIIPALSFMPIITVKCIDGLNGVITGTLDLGSTSGGGEYAAADPNADDTNDITTVVAISPQLTATSIYFSFTPSANWSTITNGNWKIWITYIDNSIL